MRHPNQIFSNEDQSISQQIISGVSWIARVPASHLCFSTNLKDDLSLDAIDFTLLISQLEHRFDLVLSKEEVAKIETIKDLIACFSKHLEARVTA